MEIVVDIPTPEECANRIFNYSGQKFEPDVASDCWMKVLHHKWFLSEKLGRDVGFKVACMDFLENTESIQQELMKEQTVSLLKELGAQVVDRAIWETISETQPPKRIVDKMIILPLTEVELAQKHGVTPPRTIIFFGPPGTGKTHFVKAIAGVLGWWYIEASPSDLMADGQDKLGKNLKQLMEKASKIDNAVIFIDEFEEIASNRDQASRVDKSITNEFLKQVPLFKKQAGNTLLVCATNYIDQLDAALLRPGRFDLIIPVGALDSEGRKTIFNHYLNKTNHGNVDVDKLVEMLEFFTPADIEYLFRKVTQRAFEAELSVGEDYKVATSDFQSLLPEIKPTLNVQLIEKFNSDCKKFTRL